MQKTTVQFPSPSTDAGIAAAEQAALALPEMSALAEQAGLSQAANGTAAAAPDGPASPVPSLAEAAQLSPSGAVVAPAPAGDNDQAAAGPPAEAAAEVGELQALQAEMAAAISGSCENATVLDLLAGERSFSSLLGLIRTAGKAGDGKQGGLREAGPRGLSLPAVSPCVDGALPAAMPADMAAHRPARCASRCRPPCTAQAWRVPLSTPPPPSPSLRPPTAPGGRQCSTTRCCAWAARPH